MEGKKFATAINCMDGRVQVPVVSWLIKEYGVDYVDMITEPGPNKIIAENRDTFLIESIKNRLGISINKHRSELIAITGHHDCAGNPVNEVIQKSQILDAVKVVESWGFNVKVIGLWIDKDWKVYKVLGYYIKPRKRNDR